MKSLSVALLLAATAMTAAPAKKGLRPSPTPRPRGATAYERMMVKEATDHRAMSRCITEWATQYLERVRRELKSGGLGSVRLEKEDPSCAPMSSTWEQDKIWLISHDAPRGVNPFVDHKANEFACQELLPPEPTPTSDSDEITPPRLLTKIEPIYPVKAQKKGKEGIVILEARITEAGDVIEVKVLRQLDPLLDAAAADAVRFWKYEPARKAGRPVAVYLTVNITFSLHR